MIIGLVLCGIVAVLLFFGVAEHVFKSFGVAYWLAFVMVGVLIGSAFIPSFMLGSAEINVAGFIAPVTFSVVFFILAARTREIGHALVTMTVNVALSVSVLLLLQPITSEVVTTITVGFLCGAVSYLVGKTKLSALAAVFSGIVVGEIVSSAVNMYVYGTPIRVGSAGTFDAVILAAVFAVVLFEAISAIKRTMNARARKTAADNSAETAEEFDENEYKKYFDE